MPFDLGTATPVGEVPQAAPAAAGGFDLGSAQPVSGPRARARPAPTPEDPTSIGNLLGAAIEPTLAIGTGGLGAVAGGLSGFGRAVQQAAGFAQGAPSPGDQVRNVQGALSYTPKTTGGKNAMKVIGYPFEKLGEGARWAGEKTQDLTGSPGLATQVQTLLEFLPMLLGSKGAGAAADAAPTFAKPPGSRMTPAIQELTDRGIPITPGQLLGPGWSKAESAVERWPIIGSPVRMAKTTGLEAFNRSAIGDALAPIGQKLPGDMKGSAAIAHARKTLGQAYDDVLLQTTGDLHSRPPGPAPGTSVAVPGEPGRPPAPTTITPDRNFDNMNAQRGPEHDAFAKQIEANPEGWHAKDAYTTADMVLTPDLETPGHWRITQFDDLGQPISHTDYDSLQLAASAFPVQAKPGSARRFGEIPPPPGSGGGGGRGSNAGGGRTYDGDFSSSSETIPPPPGPPRDTQGPSLAMELADIVSAAKASRMKPDKIAELENILQTEITDRFQPQTGKASGDTLQDIKSKLTKLAKVKGRSEDYDVQHQGLFITKANQALRSMIDRENPQHADTLRAIDEGYGKFKIAQNAAGKPGTGANEGVFTPSQYDAAVRLADKTKDKRAYSEGTANQQHLSRSGRNLLSERLPDSGTSYQLALLEMFLGGGGHYLMGPMGAAAMAAPALYSKAGMNAMQRLILNPPNAGRGAAKGMPFAFTGDDQ